MTTKIDARAFISDLKENGISIQNESNLAQALSESSDAGFTLEKLCIRGNAENIAFFLRAPLDESTLSKLSKVFIKNGLDGFTFHKFLDGLRTQD